MIRWGILTLLASLSPAVAMGESLTAATLLDTLRVNQAAIQGCHDSRVDSLQNPTGSLVLRFVIRRNGLIGRISTAEDDIKDTALEACVKFELKRIRFPKPSRFRSSPITFAFQFAPGRPFPIPPKTENERVTTNSEKVLQANAEAPKPKIALMRLTAKRVDKVTVEILDDLLANAVHSTGRYQTIAASDINALLGFENMKDALGCNEVSCAAEIGGALGVDFLLAGSVSKLGSKIIISLKLLSTKEQRVEARAEYIARRNEDEFPSAITTAVAMLLGQKSMVTPKTTIAAGAPRPRNESADVSTLSPELEPVIEEDKVSRNEAPPATKAPRETFDESTVGSATVPAAGVGAVGGEKTFVARADAQSDAKQERSPHSDALAPKVAAVEDPDAGLSEEDSGPSILPIALWVVGAAGIGSGAWFFVKANSHQNNANDENFVGAQAEIGKGQSAETIAWLAGGIGLGSVIAGFLIRLLMDKQNGSPSVSVWRNDESGGISAKLTVTF